MDLVERAAAILEGPQALRPRPEPDAREARVVEFEGLAQVRPGHQQAAAQPAPAMLRPTEDGLQAPASRTVIIDRKRLKARSVITPGESRTMMTESFQRVKRHILANAARPDASPVSNLVMITSALPREGKTFCAVNLAVSLAMEVNRTVLLVDGDFEHPSVCATLGIATGVEQGFLDCAADPSLPLSRVLLKTDIGSLIVLPPGKPRAHVTELLAAEATAALLRQIATRYADRIVIFDSAPLLAASEACALAAHMGQVVLVVEAGKTREEVLMEAVDLVSSCNVTGVLLNKGVSSRARGLYGYDYASDG